MDVTFAPGSRSSGHYFVNPPLRRFSLRLPRSLYDGTVSGAHLCSMATNVTSKYMGSFNMANALFPWRSDLINAIAHAKTDHRHFLFTLLHLHLHKRGGLSFGVPGQPSPLQRNSDGKVGKLEVLFVYRCVHRQPTSRAPPSCSSLEIPAPQVLPNR